MRIRTGVLTVLLTLVTAVGTAAAQPGAPEFVLEDRLIVFVVSLLIGGLAIHIAATLIGAGGDYPDAVVAALLGALAWVLVAWIPFIGTLLALLAWIWVLKWRYPVGWVRAAMMGIAAWAVAVVVLAALSLLNIGSLEAIGVPGA